MNQPITYSEKGALLAAVGEVMRVKDISADEAQKDCYHEVLFLLERTMPSNRARRVLAMTTFDAIGTDYTISAPSPNIG